MTSTSRLRRAGAVVRRVPVVGGFIRNGYALGERLLWTYVLTPLRYRRLALKNRLTDFRNARAHTARNVTRKNTRRAYEKLYRSDGLLVEYLDPSRLAFYGTVASIAAALHPSSIVDVGCGTGHLLRAVLDRVGPLDVVGIDYARSAIRRAVEIVPEANLVVADLGTFAPNRTFDLVLCTEVLEHTYDPDAARSALARLAGPGGRILATVPDGERDDWEGHVNFWSLEGFRMFLGSLGQVEVRRIEGDVLVGVVAVGRTTDL